MARDGSKASTKVPTMPGVVPALKSLIPAHAPGSQGKSSGSNWRRAATSRSGAQGARYARIDRPIIIIGCNRSGTTLLFNTLSAHPQTWSLYVESQPTFHRHFPIDNEQGERVGKPAPPAVERNIRRELVDRAHSKEYFQRFPVLRHVPTKLFQRPVGRLYKRGPLRLVEKTPANSMRIPLLASLFPDARFIHLVRRGEDVVSSLMEGWKLWSKTGPGQWHYQNWHYLVPPGWRNWIDRPLQDICAFQWTESNRYALEDLRAVPRNRQLFVRHEDVLSDPRAEYARIMDFCELDSSPHFFRLIDGIDKRVFTTGGSTPRREKWRDLHGAELASVKHLIDPMNIRLYGGRQVDSPARRPSPAALSSAAPYLT